ncbi:MAG: starch synthase [Omnitrophica bacterium GWA2_52_8]|nr:MAG: starch synthase [Omnitrophica bacterium GWA2_52_8]
MKVAFVASEMVPFAKTGGLADVTGTLCREIASLGHDVVAFLPRYKSIDPQRLELKVEIKRLSIPVGSENELCRVLSYQDDKSKIRVYLVDHPEFYCRDELYGTGLGDYPDNDRRFIYFQRAVLETIKAKNIRLDVIHCHDWQSGLIPVYLKTLYREEPVFEKVKTVLSIHNLGYQGNFPPDSMPLTGLDWDQFKMDRLEFYGKVSFLKAGILDADAVATVSERYAEEIQTKEFSCGMDGVFRRRHDKIYGILNGIDPDEWNPKEDYDLVARYDGTSLEKKKENKRALQRENRLEENEATPLVGVISRLADQKGIDILLPALETILDMGCQFVLLGTGEERYHHLLREFAKKRKSQTGIHIVFDSKMAKRMYAGCDMLLLPSYYEPCGLGQLIALRFGTIPVVRATGGLADTIIEFDPKKGTGNGFRFEDYSSEALVAACQRALKIYTDKKAWPKLLENAVACDFSWTRSAKKYVELYRELAERPVKERGK